MRTLRNLLAVFLFYSLVFAAFCQTTRSGPSSSTTTVSASSGQSNYLRDTTYLDSLKINNLYETEVTLKKNRTLYFPVKRTWPCAILKAIKVETSDNIPVSVSYNINTINLFDNSGNIRIPIKFNNALANGTIIYVSFTFDISNCGADGSTINTSQMMKAQKPSTAYSNKPIPAAKQMRNQVPTGPTVITTINPILFWALKVYDPYGSIEIKQVNPAVILDGNGVKAIEDPVTNKPNSEKSKVIIKKKN